MRFYLSILALSVVFLADLGAQCIDGKLTDEVWATIGNDFRRNSAYTYGMTSYQLLEDNFYFNGQEDPLFYLGYSKAMWFGARDADGNLKVSANSFPTLDSNDFVPGPLDRQTGQPIDTLCGVYNRVWKINQFEIFVLRSQFQDGTLTLEDIPTDILEWPAQGNPYLEEFSPDYDLAPFNDVSGDGIYDPLTGDYPIVLVENPEFIPAEFTFLVYNDVTDHTNSGGEPLQMEVHQTNYVVSFTQETEAEQSVFTRIKYHYLGQEPLAELKVSLFEDNDLACNVNDYVGCSTDLNCSYYYNQNGETFVGSCHDFDVPDNNGAIRSTVFLSHQMKTFKHFFLFGIGEPLTQGLDPENAEEHYNYMSGLWRDGEPQTVGGIGYDPTSTNTTLFAYPDRPDQNGWSMQTAEIEIPIDTRALTTLVDDTQVQPGATGTIDFVDYFLYDTEIKRLEIFEEFPERVDTLKAEFDRFLNGTFSGDTGLEACTADCVWPGDANRDNAVTTKDYLFVGVLAGQNIDGVPRGITSTEWFGFNAENWMTEFLGIDIKNGDVNGNGTINEFDVFAIDDNFGLNRDGFSFQEELLVPVPGENKLVLSLEENEIDLATAQLFDRIIGLEVNLTGPTSEVLSPGIHGISFDMRYDTNMVTPFVFLTQGRNAIFQHDFAFVNDQERNGNELLGDNKIQYAFTNYNSTNIEESGLLIDQDMLIRETATTSNPDGRDTLVIKFYNVCVTNASGQSIEMDAQYDTLFLSSLMIDADLTSDVEEVDDLQTTLNLYPNPVTSQVHLQMEEPITGVVKVIDLQGRLMEEMKVTGDQLSIPTEAYAAGLYFLQLTTESGETATLSFVKEIGR